MFPIYSLASLLKSNLAKLMNSVNKEVKLQVRIMIQAREGVEIGLSITPDPNVL